MDEDKKMLISEIVGWIGVPFAILLFLSPLKMIKTLIREKNAEKVSELIFVGTCLQCIFGLNYFIRDYGLVIIVSNSLGIAFETTYFEIFCFFKYKNLLKKIIVMALSVVAIVGIFVGSFYLPLFVVGYLSMGFNFVLYSGPLQKMYKVVKTYDYTLIPMPVNICGLMLSLCFFTYSVCINNIYVILPNGFGILVGFVTIFLFLFTRPLYKLTVTINKLRKKIAQLKNPKRIEHPRSPKKSDSKFKRNRFSKRRKPKKNNSNNIYFPAPTLSTEFTQSNPQTGFEKKSLLERVATEEVLINMKRE